MKGVRVTPPPPPPTFSLTEMSAEEVADLHALLVTAGVQIHPVMERVRKTIIEECREMLGWTRKEA